MWKDPDAKKRFEFDLDDHNKAIEYLKNRATQLLRFDAELVEVQKYNEAVVGIFLYKKIKYQYIYLLKSYRNKNIFQKIHSFNPMPILITKETKVEEFAKNKGFDYKVILPDDSNPYQTIAKYFGNELTTRSKQFKMNHIDEGLAVMKWRKSSKYAMAAFCLHPMLQDDCDLQKNKRGKELSLPDTRVPIPVVILAMEFRNIANQFKLLGGPKKVSEVKKYWDLPYSNLKDVTEMLIADKVQDRKNFEEHGTWSNEKEAEKYYSFWLEKLSVTEKDYLEYKNKLTISPKIIDKSNIKIEVEKYEVNISELNKMKERLEENYLLSMI